MECRCLEVLYDFPDQLATQFKDYAFLRKKKLFVFRESFKLYLEGHSLTGKNYLYLESHCLEILYNFRNQLTQDYARKRKKSNCIQKVVALLVCNTQSVAKIHVLQAPGFKTDRLNPTQLYLKLFRLADRGLQRFTKKNIFLNLLKIVSVMSISC